MNVCTAECDYPGSTQGKIIMSGRTEAIAKKKLQLCLENKPYSQLDNQKNSL